MPYQPPFEITPTILSQIAEICEQIGRLEGVDWGSSSPYLRKDNRIRSIHSSLAIENNTLSLDQVTDVINGKRVLGLEREIQEVKNAFKAYDSLDQWSPSSPDNFLSAHAILMNQITADAGQFRSGGVGIYRGSQLVHMAPPADRVHHLIAQLFDWLATTDTHPLLASAITHYEIEFIHPFSDGNGRIGRLWQTLILSRWNPLLAHLPVETIIHREQSTYYAALAKSDTKASATPFIEFIHSALISSLRQAIASEKITHTDPVSDLVSDPVKTLLSTLSKHGESSIAQLTKILKLNHRPTFRKNYLHPALDAELIEMTQPNSPNSPTQKYRLTNKGIEQARRK